MIRCIFTDIVVDVHQALKFAVDIAKGMEFLHSMEPVIPNLALNSKHVLVSVSGLSVCIQKLLIATKSANWDRLFLLPHAKLISQIMLLLFTKLLSWDISMTSL